MLDIRPNHSSSLREKQIDQLKNQQLAAANALRVSFEKPIISVQSLTKSYHIGSMTVPVLKGIDLCVKEGEFVSIMGPSGSGKSTLLNVLGILDRYDDGEYVLDGTLIKPLSETEATRHRNHLIGFVFQSFNLLPFKSAIDNVAMPLYYQKVPRKQREERARKLLERMGLASRMDHLPSELSGGQRQRVAIARALVTDPPLILADEPTGNLDTKTSEEVMELFTEINHEGKTLVVITHDEEVAERTRRVIHLQDGRIRH
ncbi:ABC transporter ATP-binding protein [Methylobacter sp.]|uniref:ABC transporter ATP-binding protein n=2 Tax=unclassified Methylobacter TaxID=2635283 RepID=UPI003DA1DAAC